MKKKWFGLGCLSSFLLLILGIVILFNSISRLNKKEIKVEPNTILELNLTGEISEYNELSESSFFSKSTGASSLIQKIEQAATDPNIESILLKPSFVMAGYATCNEIIKSLQHFQENGKKVYSYLENSYDKDYYLAAVSDRIFLNPSASAGLILTGFSVNMNYYKNLLDKIGIEIEVLHAGKYKGSYENFNKNQMSHALKQNLEQLIDSRYEEMVTSLSQNRGIDFIKLDKLYRERENLFISQQHAVESGLVDELASLPELYSKLNITENRLLNYRNYNIKIQKISERNVAVVYLNGNIMPSYDNFNMNLLSYKKVDEILDKVERNGSVKAVVLRINSPGGSAMESKLILDRINELKKKMPVVVSFANVAASGGYQISAMADYIYADPSSLTGSIGVVGMIPNASKLTEKLGINNEVIKRGKFAEFYNPLREFDPDFLDSMKKNMDSVYTEFKQIVSLGRNIPYDKMESRAQGRVFTALEAKELMLIDEVGNLKTAVNKAGELAKVENYGELRYPKKKTMFQLFYKNLFNREIWSYIGKSKLEYKLKKAIDFYQELQVEPIQLILPWNIDENSFYYRHLN